VLSTIDEKSRRLGFSPVCTMVSYGGPIELLRDVTFDIAERPLLRSYLFELSGR
jgi:hypothetical protein